MPRVDTRRLEQPGRLDAVRRARALLTGVSPVHGLVRLAARAVVAPAGLVTLVERDRLEIVGSHGLPDKLAGRTEVPLNASFCQYVVSHDAPLIIRDARQEPELHDHPALRDLGAVAYLGHPIHDPDGAPIGSLCVADTVPRRWTDDDIAAVAEAAHLLEGILVAEATSRQLATNSAQSRTMLDSAVEAFVAIDMTGRIKHWNTAASQTFGWTVDEATGRDVADLIIPERFRAAHRAALTRLAAGGPGRLLGQRLQLWALHREGHEFPIEMTLSVTEGVDGPQAHAFLYDITERVSAERALARDRRFLEALLDSLDAGVVACDEQGRLILFNRALRQIHGGVRADGSTAAEWAQRFELRHVDGRPMRPAEVPLSRAFQGETIRDAEVIVQAPDTRARAFLANGQPIRDDDGARLGAVVAMHEVTERRRAERFMQCELQVSRVLAEARTPEEAGAGVLEAVSATLRWPYAEMWLVDDVVKVLRPVATFTDEHYALDEHLPEVLHPGEGLAGRAWESGGPVWFEDLAVEPNQVDRSALVEQGIRAGLSIPIRGGSGILGALNFFGDVAETSDDALMAQLSGIAAHIGQFLERQRAEELAQELARTKDEFIALVGHELRTPLTSISAYTELLLTEDSATNEHLEEFLGVIHRNAETLRAIVDDLLDLAGLESGYVILNTRPVDLAAIVDASVAAVRSEADVAGLSLVVDVVPGEVPIEGDAARLRQVVDHLLSNAVKYTPAGGRVDVRLESTSTGAVLTVADTGIGIPPEERQRLFRRFFRGSNTRSQRIPGTGLGLAIARTIVERHGGTITAGDRDDGQGTSFTVRLPTA